MPGRTCRRTCARYGRASQGSAISGDACGQSRSVPSAVRSKARRVRHDAPPSRGVDRVFFSTANASIMLFDIEDEGISSSRRPVRGIPACTYGQGVLSLLYTGWAGWFHCRLPIPFPISSSTRPVLLPAREHPTRVSRGLPVHRCGGMASSWLPPEAHVRGFILCKAELPKRTPLRTPVEQGAGRRHADRRWGGLGAADACQRADGQFGLCPRQRSNICCSFSHLGLTQAGATSLTIVNCQNR